MDWYEYMCTPTQSTPKKLLDKYNLYGNFYNGYIYLDIQKGMYGLVPDDNDLLLTKISNQKLMYIFVELIFVTIYQLIAQ